MSTKETRQADKKGGFSMNKDLKEFYRAYIAAALWSSSDNLPGYNEEESGYIEPTPLDEWEGDLALGTLKAMLKNCKSFLLEANPIIEAAFDDWENFPNLTYSSAGHDFWLTHNGHGAGFWDRDWPDKGKELTRLARKFSEICLYIGDDGQIHGI